MQPRTARGTWDNETGDKKSVVESQRAAVVNSKYYQCCGECSVILCDEQEQQGDRLMCGRRRDDGVSGLFLDSPQNARCSDHRAEKSKSRGHDASSW